MLVRNLTSLRLHLSHRHTLSIPYIGKAFTVEMHHQRANQTYLGDNVVLNI